jgi:guanosine-3',5'-bis(diphosphate) 3'-pyrophosphohydrolase
MFMKCAKCNEITNHLLVYKEHQEYWECQECGIAEIPKLTLQKQEGQEDMRWTLKEMKAEKLAEFIHCGQKRRNGEPFVNHPKNVAHAIKRLGCGEDMVCASFLHDMEDFQFYTDMLHMTDKIFGYKVFGLVLLLSHVPKTVPYNDYIAKIANMSPDEAMIIKWQDMIDNTKNETVRQHKKYRDACLFLQSKGIVVPEILIKRLGMFKIDD